MKLVITTTTSASRSAFVAPTFGGAVAGVCPQAGFRHVDGHTQVSVPTTGNAGMVTGHRSWSPPIS